MTTPASAVGRATLLGSVAATFGAAPTGALSNAGASEPAPPAASARFKAKLYAPTHRPRAGKAWRIRIVVRTTRGRPLHAEVRYQFLFGGRVVARRSHYRFRGTFRDSVVWPRRSVGVPLTFRAVVTTRLGKRNLDYNVVVRR